MASATLNLTIEQGADFERVLTIKDGAGTAINLTGYSFAGQIRRKIHDPTLLASFSFTLAAQSGGTLGMVTAAISNANTSLLPAFLKADGINYEELYYDIEMSTPASKKERILQGTVTIKPEVTR